MITQVGAVNSFTGAEAAKKPVNTKAVAAGTIAGVAALATAAFFAPKALDKFVKNLPEDMAEAKWYQKAVKFVADKTGVFHDFVAGKATQVTDFAKGIFKKAPEVVEDIQE